MGKKLLIFFTLILASCSEEADLIVYNAEIYTVNPKNNKATSFAVKDGKFIYVGDDSAISKYSSSNIIKQIRNYTQRSILILFFIIYGFLRFPNTSQTF